MISTVNQPLKKWMLAANGDQKAQLARLAGTTIGQLNHLVIGSRRASSKAAIRIEKAAAKIKARGAVELPKLTRMDLNETCRGCEYARLCTGRERLW